MYASSEGLRAKPLAPADPVARVLARLTELGALGLLASICAEHRVRREAVLGKFGTTRVVRARQHFWALLKWTLPDMSYSELAEIFDRNHTTIMEGIHRHERGVERLMGAVHAAP